MDALYLSRTHTVCPHGLLTVEHSGFLRVLGVSVQFLFLFNTSRWIYTFISVTVCSSSRLCGLSVLGWYPLEFTSASLLPKGEPETQWEHNKYRLTIVPSQWRNNGLCFSFPASQRVTDSTKCPWHAGVAVGTWKLPGTVRGTKG